MKVTVTHLMGTNREIADYARTTIGLNGGDKKVSDEYMRKLDHFITSRTVGVKGLNNQYQLRACYEKAAGFYPSVNSNKTTGRTKTGNKSK